MAVFVTILEGPTAAEAQPILAVRDPAIIAALRQLILERLGGAPISKASLFRLPKAKKEG